MTALKPADGQWEGVASVRYPLGSTCAHPECDRTDVTAHHIFPRGKIGNSSWFVLPTKGVPGLSEGTRINDKAIPHVVPLCGHGTAGHHGDVEMHKAWIKYEDGVFNWYAPEEEHLVPGEGVRGGEGLWKLVGPLKPQPAEPATKPKRRKTATTSEERKARVTYSVKTPKGEENVLPELEEALREKLHEEMGWQDDVPAYFVWAAAAARALQ